MSVLKSLIALPGYYGARQGRFRGPSRARRQPRPMLLERLENRLCLSTWSEPVNLGPIVNSSSDDADPALSPDGLSLYFFSNRPGGFGTSDIWVSRRANLTEIGRAHV